MENKPNILLIAVDQMRRDPVGVSGNPVIQTPNLDTMKKHGVIANCAYSAVPTCVPARASLFTGLTQKTHGRIGYQDGIPWNYEQTIASEFSNAGYHTQSVGKMHVFPERNLCGFHNVVLHDGYLHHSRNVNREGSFLQRDDYLHWLKSKTSIDTDIIDSGLECNSWVARTWPYDEHLHPSNWVVSESIDFLRRRDTSKPFFLFTSFVRPHSPLDPPEYYYNLYANEELPSPVCGEWSETEDKDQNGLNLDCKWGNISKSAQKLAKAAYYGSITHIDHQIGRLLQSLTEYQVLDNTIVLFVSDHGDMMGDHHFFRKALPYEGSIGVPFIIYDPGNLLDLPQNVETDALIELRDVMPTLLEAANINIPTQVEGKSVLQALRGNSKEFREYIHGEHPLEHYSNQFIVTSSDKYVWFSKTGKEQYFDLQNDPCEMKNLIEDVSCKERIDYLRSKLIYELSGREEGYTDGKVLFVGRNPKNALAHIL